MLYYTSNCHLKCSKRSQYICPSKVHSAKKFLEQSNEIVQWLIDWLVIEETADKLWFAKYIMNQTYVDQRFGNIHYSSSRRCRLYQFSIPRRKWNMSTDNKRWKLHSRNINDFFFLIREMSKIRHILETTDIQTLYKIAWVRIISL